MKSKTFILINAILFFLIVSACSKEEPDRVDDLLIGLWMLSEKTVDSEPIILDDCEKQSSLEFHENNLVTIYDACNETSINSGWIYRYDMLNIAVHLPAGYYIDHLDNTTLKISRYDLSTGGDRLVTTLTYLKQ